LYNFDFRIIQHNSALYQDAFTSKGIPWDLFLYIEGNNSTQAYNIE
jgi:putative endonuclease